MWWPARAMVAGRYINEYLLALTCRTKSLLKESYQVSTKAKIS